jgi:hypothetical protein
MVFHQFWAWKGAQGVTKVVKEANCESHKTIDKIIHKRI